MADTHAGCRTHVGTGVAGQRRAGARLPDIVDACFTVTMTVYVDSAIFHWRGRRWAHLMADDLDELHAFAARLGLPRRAFQDRRSGAHYDVDTDTRAQALRLGAVALSRLHDRERMRAVIANARRQWSGA